MKHSPHNYPIVSTRTPDNYTLHGLLIEAANKDTLLIHIHGTASNFYIEDFYPALADALTSEGISYLSPNNRGANALQGWVPGGSTTERFEDCVSDIDAWIHFAIQSGYSNILLSGHSLGTEKVVYFMNHGTHREKVSGIVLMAPADSYGYTHNFLKTVDSDLFAEARDLVSKGRGDEFLRGTWLAHGGVLPKSAASFLNFFDTGSSLSQVLPFQQRALPLYRNIQQPILAIISNNQADEYTLIPIAEALDLMMYENPNTQTKLIENSDHCFVGKEDEMARIVTNFCKNVLAS